MPKNKQKKLPTFLCIGAQRSGSTWLYENLKAHEGIWLPPIKELHYFDQLRLEPFFSKRYKKELRSRLRETRAALIHGDWSVADSWWDLKFFCWPRSNRWYSGVFSQGKRLAAGDITPAYATLSSDVVSMIKDINPNMKVIFLMRDPIDRSWSQARKDLPRVYGRPLTEIAQEQVIRWFNEQWCALRSDYVRTLDIWLAHFPVTQFFFGFLEEIISDPRALLLRLFDFLGVERSEKYVPDTVHAVVNAKAKTDMSPVYEYELARIHEPKLARLKEMFDRYPSQWHARCVRVLDRHGAP